jgi:Domain of unknown function (DUF4123)
MASPRIDLVISHLWRPAEGRTPEKVYALVDAARSESIYPKIMAAKVESVCLHRGKMAKDLAWVAPYLVRLQREDTFTQWLVDSGWGNNRCVFVRSSATLHELKRHFRAFLTVYDEEGKSYLFRFYDPRVLGVYLPTCNENELKIFYGPVTGYYMEGEEGEQVVEYSCIDGCKLVQNKITL